MGRSVSTPSGASTICFIHLEHGDEENSAFEWDWFIEEIQSLIAAKYRSFTKEDEWLGREDRVILVNRHAHVTVSEYCGLVAICVVPKEDQYGNDVNITQAWCRQIDAGFTKLINSTFAGLEKTGTMSNGESVFKRVS